MLIAVFITEMVILHKYVYLLLLLFTDRIGRHEGQLPINQNYNKI